VAALSHVSGSPIRAFIVRKESKGHGTQRQIEGNLEPGCRVIVVDDVVTTGGSTLKAIEAALGQGYEIKAVISLVDREEGGEEKLSDWPYYPLFRRHEIFDETDGNPSK
jgi:orotate phosphoribosyltransferase